jgi:hypothetical protein
MMILGAYYLKAKATTCELLHAIFTLKLPAAPSTGSQFPETGRMIEPINITELLASNKPLLGISVYSDIFGACAPIGDVDCHGMTIAQVAPVLFDSHRSYRHFPA